MRSDSIELISNELTDNANMQNSLVYEQRGYHDESQADQNSLVNLDDMNVMTIHNPEKNIYRVISLCIWTFSCGYTDAAPGALLPFIEAYYNVNYTLVSLIWMSNAVGFLTVASLAHKIQPWFGKRNSLLLGCFLSVVQFAMISSGSHFALIVIAFFFGGAGLGICLAQANVFLANLDKLTLYLSFNHASYGLGATASPLISTLMVSQGGIKWNYVYLINLGLMLVNMILLGFAFKGADEDLKPWETDEQSNEAGPTPTSSKGSMKDAVKNKITWILAFFVLFYQGCEVSLAGWCVTYLIDYKGGSKSTIGYVALAFWFGLTLGRLLITHTAVKIVGARRTLLIMCLLTILVVILAWTLPNLIASSAFIALAGVWIGPLYSLVVGTSVKPGMLPRKIQVTSLTIVTAFGAAGGAIFPFIIGLISQSSGTYVVFPVCISLYGTMMLLWIALPNIESKSGKQDFWHKIW